MIIGMGNDEFKPLWPEIIRTALYITNQVATRTLEDLTPIKSLTLEFSTPKRPNLLNLRTISCRVYYHLAKEKRRRGAKFEDRAKQGILVGFEGNSIYRIYDPTHRSDNGIVRALAVTFDETHISRNLDLSEFVDDKHIYILEDAPT